MNSFCNCNTKYTPPCLKVEVEVGKKANNDTKMLVRGDIKNQAYIFQSSFAFILPESGAYKKEIYKIIIAPLQFNPTQE